VFFRCLLSVYAHVHSIYVDLSRQICISIRRCLESRSSRLCLCFDSVAFFFVRRQARASRLIVSVEIIVPAVEAMLFVPLLQFYFRFASIGIRFLRPRTPLTCAEQAVRFRGAATGGSGDRIEYRFF